MSKMQVLHVEKLQHEATSRGHSILADEPEGAGGDDRGMTPYELLLAALGTCTAMTLRLYAERKKWDLQDVSVQLSHTKSHADDCERCETREGKLDVMYRKVEITGDLDDEQRARLMEIADRCPVHRTLEGTIEILEAE
jgi:putative redox protein